MPEEAPDEADVEAEMLRMMQEEAEGGASAEDADTSAETTSGEETNADDVLEQEMLRAMQEGKAEGDAADSSEDAGPGPFLSQLPGLSEAAETIERLADVDVTVTVELGGNHIPIKDILAWTRDSVVELEPEEHEPLNVLVNGKLFARGEMVVVGDTFGVRIIKLMDQPDEPRF